MRIRSVLGKLAVPQAASYGTHDFRRGHAQDIVQDGGTLAQVLAAGQWKSAAFMSYIKEAELERVSLLVDLCIAWCIHALLQHLQDVAMEVAIESEDEGLPE